MKDSSTQWSAEKQCKLRQQLVGFWARDVWDMQQFPLPFASPPRHVRYIRFTCRSQPLNTELKYACWQKYQRKQWVAPNKSCLIHALVKWLNHLDPADQSLMMRSLSAWEALYRAYLIERGTYTKGSTRRLDGSQQMRCDERDSPYISTLRQVYFMLAAAYDERPEVEKDVWDIRKMGVCNETSLCNYKLNFTKVKQPWLRAAAKRYLSYCLPLYAVGHCATKLRAISAFSSFLGCSYPAIEPAAIDREVMLRYLGQLATGHLSKGVQKYHAVNLRCFLEVCAREGWANFRKERLIFDDELPQTSKYLPRYIPEDVLDQLNRHLHALPDHYRRIILIFQECGMRISELLALSFSCLERDARGGWFLRYYQGKMKREHAIPISAEIAAEVQEQQREVSSLWGDQPPPYLFPNKQGVVFKQYAFAQALNRLAYEKGICDSTGRLFRFQSHQFRHTVGTRMINMGVPQHIVQRYLGHKSPEMTNRYAHLHDQTMREKLAEYLGSRVIDITGTAIEERPEIDTVDLQWFTRNVLAQALPNGYCAIPTAAGPCPHPNACLTCTHFRTDHSFVQIHRAELQETERVLEKARANGWARQVEMNERKRASLQVIITALEENHD